MMRQVFLGAMLLGTMLVGTRVGIAAEMPTAKITPVAASTVKHSQPTHHAAAPHKAWSSHRKHKMSGGTTASKTAPAHTKTLGQTGQ